MGAAGERSTAIIEFHEIRVSAGKAALGALIAVRSTEYRSPQVPGAGMDHAPGPLSGCDFTPGTYNRLMAKSSVSGATKAPLAPSRATRLLLEAKWMLFAALALFLLLVRIAMI